MRKTIETNGIKLWILAATLLMAALGQAQTRINVAPGSTLILMEGQSKKVITLSAGDEVIVTTDSVATKKECLSSGGKTVCGYNCVSEYGQVRCADDPRAKCLASYGKIACGYDCKADYGQIVCARTPQGVCASAYGRVTCVD